jgi:hypothetical protein
MSKQGKLYGALLRDWAHIVGAERAQVTRPARLQFSTKDASGAILHLNARPSAAPELAYAHEQMLEQCARYFGYRAIERLVIHANHEGFHETKAAPATRVAAPPPEAYTPPPLPPSLPNEMRQVLERISRHITSPSDKK